jgi:competence protein ComEA
MNSPLDSMMTKDEQKILGFVGIFMILGMLLYYSGISALYTDQSQSQQEALKQVTQMDSIYLIDIRTASAQELTMLSGIGEKRALDIIAYRERKQFESPEELLNIKGIGAKTYLNMQPMLLTFGTAGSGVKDKQKLSAVQNPELISEANSASIDKQELDGTGNIAKKERIGKKSSVKADNTIINLNTASKQDLMSLDGIGEVKADAIISYRNQIGKFTSIEQLLDVKGIGTKTLEKNRQRLSL